MVENLRGTTPCETHVLKHTHIYIREEGRDRLAKMTILFWRAHGDTAHWVTAATVVINLTCVSQRERMWNVEARGRLNVMCSKFFEHGGSQTEHRDRGTWWCQSPVDDVNDLHLPYENLLINYTNLQTFPVVQPHIHWGKQRSSQTR